VTAQALLAKLSEQGTDLGAAEERMLPIEQLGKRITRMDKLRAFVLARTSWASLRKARVADTAVILFTSGSESLPKAVPLTHANVLTNLRDTLAIVDFRAGDRAIGFLPPFHSFGLTCTVVLALAAGVPVVYHPNPTEGLAIARIVHAYRTTLLIGTPTFLAGAVRAATDDDLACLRFVISGAEKCPDSLHDTIAKRWPGMALLEGYGITECSPIVSANRENAVRRGSIGWPLPSIEHAVIDVERGGRVAQGQVGMLLVRGPSVFSGYIGHDAPSPFEELEDKRWYRTGDLVREEPDGRLMFSGRLKRFIKLGGEMISLPAIEEALVERLGRAEDGAIDIAVEATPSEQSPEIVLFAARAVTREEANAAVRAAGLSALHNVRTVRRVEAIPLLGTGKTDYRALKAMLMEA
jgi:long-chain-fatty-acid--[acyl-carrier-protein] ligase